MKQFPSFETAPQEQSHASPSPEQIDAAVLRVTQKSDGSALSVQQMASRLDRLPEEERNAVAGDERFIDAVAVRVTEPGKPLMTRLEHLPESFRDSVLHHPKVIEAVVNYITDSKKPLMPGLELKHLPSEFRDSIIRHPRVIEAVIQYVTEQEKPAKTRWEHLPEDIAELIKDDPRIQEISQ